MTRTRLEGQARTAVGRLASEIRGAKIDPFAGGAATVHTLTFRRRYGAYHENAIQNFDDFDLSTARIRWDQLPQATLRLDLAPGEIANGRDDNSNGIADECVVSHVVGGVTTALCTNVASNGLTFRWASAKTLEISLTLVARDADGSSFSVPVTELVFPRN
ncbi:MAG: hypothetical protein HY292_08945 [Planctomycetes bacterium]|nr:hypothetical protein [Planctomycetota bacterium]